MTKKKTIFAIIGSAGKNSTNEKLIQHIAALTKEELDWRIFNGLQTLPHFDPQLSADNPPEAILALRANIEKADGVLICTPEYIFSIPSGLKNAIEWCAATTIFSEKPTGLITAAAQGHKAHEELQLIMQTMMARFTADTTWLIQGIKGKINEQGEITDSKTKEEMAAFVKAFIGLFN